MEQSEYVALLSRAIQRLDQNTPTARSQIYERARQALRQQLAGVEPPLSDTVIAREQQHLEEAIQQIDPPPRAQPAPAKKGQPQPSRTVTSKQIFCEHCVAESTDETPGDVSTLNGIGRQFYGSSSPCPECASVIRTLWWTLVEIPIVPLASYRYKTAQEAGPRARFWCRKLPGRHWPQVWKTSAIGLVAAIAIGIGIGLYIYNTYYK